MHENLEMWGEISADDDFREVIHDVGAWMGVDDRAFTKDAISCAAHDFQWLVVDTGKGHT